jgi:3-methyladenine DNA glycosylase AlkC
VAKKFKDYYDTDCAVLLADKVKQVYPSFDVEGFVLKITSELDGKEFHRRQDLFVDAFEQFMPKRYPETISIFMKILGPELETTEGMFTFGWWLWPVGRFVERNGVADFQTSVDFIYELTKRFTGEFAMRPLIEKYPEKALGKILTWSKNPNVHVRRLASECMRIRLPWAKKSLAALAYFETYKQILTNLNAAPEKFVQKSVGNNLNDLMKEDPAKAKEIISEWQKNGPSKETLWIIKHGLRSERKARK